MINIAIVEDEPAIVGQIKDYIEKYMKENCMDYTVSAFSSAESFLFNGANSFDIILMDIQLPEMDGMTAAKKLRETNETVVLMFVTSLAQYALKGYEVGALDFLVKPVAYSTFRAKMKKWLPVLLSRAQKDIVLNVVGGGVVKVAVGEIRYIESAKHYLIYHTSQGDYETRGTMGEAEEQLRGDGFSRSISGCLVNLAAVTKVEKDTVYLRGGVALPLARLRKKEFMEDFMNYFRTRG